jgi:hypothetical protein
MTKKMIGMLDFPLHLSHLFSVSASLGFLRTAPAFFPECMSIIARVSVALFPRFAQNLTLFLCLIHHDHSAV